MPFAVPIIGYHFSEKELIKEKSGYFLSWSLRGCSEPASQARGLAWILEPGEALIANSKKTGVL